MPDINEMDEANQCDLFEKKPRKVELKSAEVSLLLATVIAGLGLTKVWQEYSEIVLDLSDWQNSYLLPAIAITVTILRFFHGNVMWHHRDVCTEVPAAARGSWEGFFLRISSYYIHIGQYVLFYLAAASFGQQLALIKLLLFISVVDVMWAGYGWMLEDKERCPILKKALGSWAILNFFTAIFCVLALFFVSYAAPIELVILVLSSIYLFIAALDYLINKELFFLDL